MVVEFKEELLEMNQVLEQKEKEYNETNGRLQELTKRLEQHACKDVEEADILLTNLGEKLDKKEAELEILVGKLRTEFNKLNNN